VIVQCHFFFFLLLYTLTGDNDGKSWVVGF